MSMRPARARRIDPPADDLSEVNHMTERATWGGGDIKAVARLLARLDIGMLVTRASDGRLHGRPMSNNGDVEWDGDSWFFAEASSRKVKEIESDDAVELGFTDTANGTWINVEGLAMVVRDDEERKRDLWKKDLERWFPGGPEDPSVVLIKVTAQHIDAWSKDAEYILDRGSVGSAR
jgi:general stress protein 26